MRNWLAVLGVAVMILASVLSAHAQEPILPTIPTPMAIPTADPATLPDFTNWMWEIDRWDGFISMARTVFVWADRYHVMTLLTVLAIGIIVLGIVTRIASGGGATVDASSDRGAAPVKQGDPGYIMTRAGHAYRVTELED